MSKLTKRQQKQAEMLEGFVQPSSAADALKKIARNIRSNCKIRRNC